MNDKFELYDILGIVIPGSLLLALISVSFPEAAAPLASTEFPESFAVICLVALAVFLGHLIQAISSFFEPLMEWTWGGRSSERALHSGLGSRYLPADTAQRIKEKLMNAAGTVATDRSLFLLAMQKAETSGNARVSKFNGLYAYHRAMLTLVLVAIPVFVAAMQWGAAKQWPLREKAEVLAVGAGLLVIFWLRTRQRGFYYVREVLATAERIIDGTQTTKN
jgi:hypothetical protein